MPRKEKPEPASPKAPRSPAPANKYAQWRRAVKELLVAEWQDSADVDNIAATVVGMFDAGAKDTEVAAFLHSQEQSAEGQTALTDEERLALVRQLQSAGSV